MESRWVSKLRKAVQQEVKSKILKGVTSVVRIVQKKVTLEWIIVIANFIIELPSAVFDQLSSVHKPKYALIAMLMSLVAMFICIIELVYKGQKERVQWRWRGRIPWFYYPSPSNMQFGTFTDNIGLGCAISQFIVTTINYSFSHHHADNPIKISVWPIIFAFGLLCSKFLENPNFGVVTTESLTCPVILGDSQENGIGLVHHALMACAEAIQLNNLNLAEAIVKQIGFLAISETGAMRKVATYFAEALACRIHRIYPMNPLDHYRSDILQMNFYEANPYIKFAHVTTNQAILKAFEGKKSVHVIDFSMNRGMQWPSLMQALAIRSGGPPAFRLTGIGLPPADNSDYLQEVGWKLAQLAETIHVEFEYRGFVANSLADLDASMLDLRPNEIECIAVNSIAALHKLLALQGAIDKVLSMVNQMKPEIFTIVEQEANHNCPGFLDRFNESLQYYSAIFDSMEGSENKQEKLLSEVFIGKQIFNVVACEGVDRVERHETLTHWRTRLSSTGFVPVHLGSNAFNQASLLFTSFGGRDGFRVEENNGCLTIGWHTRPLIATSAWKPAMALTDSISTSTP